MSDTLHVVSLPHTQTTDEYATCAYTQRVRKFCRMMTGRGRKVILYAGEHNDAPCDEHVVVVTDEQQERWFGGHDEADLNRGGFDWDTAKPWWVEMNARAAGEIASRCKHTDLLCLVTSAQHLIAQAHSSLIVAEFAVGYEGIILNRKPSPALAAFESHTHRHLVYGKEGLQNAVRQYDCVIPNQFDPDEFPHVNEGGGDYLLFIGRLIPNKGPQTAGRVADALGMKLVVAGPGMTEQGPGFVSFDGGQVLARDIEYVGPVGITERAELMAGAAATIVPTIYAEPFGGVAVESMMAGTPAVTTDFGAFVETVVPGVSGYRFMTLQNAVDATIAAMALEPAKVRDYAIRNYSLDAVAPLYDRWFENLDGLWGEGWQTLTRAPAAAQRHRGARPPLELLEPERQVG